MEQVNINIIYIGVILLIILFGVIKFRVFEVAYKLWQSTQAKALAKDNEKLIRHMARYKIDVAELLEKNQLYEAMESTLKIGFWDWDLAPEVGIDSDEKEKRDIVKTSPNFKVIFEIDAKEVKASDLINFVLEEDRPMVNKVLEDTFFNMKPSYTMDYRIGRRNGHIYWIRCWGVVKDYDKEKKPKRIRGAIQVLDK